MCGRFLVQINLNIFVLFHEFMNDLHKKNSLLADTRKHVLLKMM